MLAFGYSNQSKVFREIPYSKFPGQHAVQLNYVDMKVYALQLKRKSTAGVFHGIGHNFGTATFENDFGGCYWKENRGNDRQ